MTETLDEIIDNLVRSAVIERNFIGHPNVLKGLKWQEVPERDGRSILFREDDPSEPAVFWTVAEISTDDFWLYADGRWNDRIKKPFSEHHATGAFVRPSEQRLARLYDEGLKGAEDVQNFSKGSHVTVFHPLLQGGKEHFLKLRHRVFDCHPIEDGDSNQHCEDGSGAEQEWARLERKWTLENWPCITEEADFNRREFLRKQLEYKPRLLEAYDEKEWPIPPDMYQQKLKGATVSCYFSITRWNIKNQYTFVPHIVTLWTLIPPPKPLYTPPTPKRRQGESTSPRKKLRVA